MVTDLPRGQRSGHGSPQQAGLSGRPGQDVFSKGDGMSVQQTLTAYNGMLPGRGRGAGVAASTSIDLSLLVLP